MGNKLGRQMYGKLKKNSSATYRKATAFKLGEYNLLRNTLMFWFTNCEKKLFGSDSHTNDLISDRFAYPSKWRRNHSNTLQGCRSPTSLGCLNSGFCIAYEGKQTFACSCKVPWIGENCEKLGKEKFKNCSALYIVKFYICTPHPVKRLSHLVGLSKI